MTQQYTLDCEFLKKHIILSNYSFNPSQTTFSFCCHFKYKYSTLEDLEKNRKLIVCQNCVWLKNETFENSIIVLNLLISRICNSSCYFCITGCNKRRYEERENIYNLDPVIEEILKKYPTIKYISFTNGEIYYDKTAREYFIYLLKKYNKKGIIITNLSLFEVDKIPLELLREIQISIYGYNKEEYISTCGLDYDIIMRNFNILKKNKPLDLIIKIKIMINKVTIKNYKRSVKIWNVLIKNIPNSHIEIYYVENFIH